MEDRGLYRFARTARESRKAREALRRLAAYSTVEPHAAVEADVTDLAALVLDMLHDPLARQFQARAEAMRTALATTTDMFRRGPKADTEAETHGPAKITVIDRPKMKKRA